MSAGGTSYTRINLRDVDDSAVRFGLSEIQEARFAGGDLEAKATGIAHQVIRPGKRQAFGHRHEVAEEVYIVLAGGGRMKLDDQIMELAPRDAVRVAPTVTRCLEAGPDGLELLVVGPSHPGDGEVISGWWAE